MKPELKGKNMTPLDKVTTLICIQRLFFLKHQVKEIREVCPSQNQILQWRGTSQNLTLGTFVLFVKIREWQ